MLRMSTCLASTPVPPYLRPFPTRRSSDLPAALVFAFSLLVLGHYLANGDPSVWFFAIQGALPLDREEPDAGISVRQVIDRKSTRLNSSHTVISYAVLCLKKKNRKRKPLRL